MFRSVLLKRGADIDRIRQYTPPKETTPPPHTGPDCKSLTLCSNADYEAPYPAKCHGMLGSVPVIHLEITGEAYR